MIKSNLISHVVLLKGEKKIREVRITEAIIATIKKREKNIEG